MAKILLILVTYLLTVSTSWTFEYSTLLQKINVNFTKLQRYELETQLSVDLSKERSFECNHVKVKWKNNSVI